MKKRDIYKLLLLLLIVILVINTVFIFLNNTQKTEITTIGSNANGTVEKIVTGNLESNETAVIILGVHPREHEIHEAVNSTIKNITDSDDNLNKRFVVYYIVVNDDIKSKADTRPAGEGLANQFIVPDVKNENPFIVVDVHEIDEYYEYSNFIFSLSDNGKAHRYVTELSEAIGVKDFTFDEGTSPELVTKPIANQGFNTLLLETSITNKADENKEIARKLIYAIDDLNP